MAYTVWGSFDYFRSNYVDLGSKNTQTARSSRDYLQGQIKTLDGTYPGFPKLLGTFMGFGSFARRTKILPLDDIDFFVIIKSSNTTESLRPEGHVWLYIEDTSSPLYQYRDDFGYVNSTKILHKIRDGLSTVSIYGKADLKKNMQAVTLKLSSYSWNFDIVPAVEVHNLSGKITHYLIPSGHGEWIRTDPRRDAEFVTTVNKSHSSLFLPTMRLLKYWNKRVHKPTLSSYYFETLVLNIFQYASSITSYQSAIKYFFDNLSTRLLFPCPDPKGLGSNLDETVSLETKMKINSAAIDDANNARLAMYHEGQNNHQEAISYWQKIFGLEFPAYG
ncbi:hypothetical protein [Herpetosiphon llansteffanensis]|uniref:hypothetical protein n=1 Tax=Herpetosiphon llansteffanensis TaxID=2094568 RepID=UPI000D7C39F7|nr:hypothetical protein [Herpetosiphon llansteffanensis]